MKRFCSDSFARLLCLAAVSLFFGACSPSSQNTVTTHSQSNETPIGPQQLFALDSVQLASGPFADAQRINVQYLLAMDPDKLLVPYLREAGLKTTTRSYGNWENSGLDGHIGGHYLSALSLAWAATGDEELKRRLDYMLGQLRTAQQANQGYLGGIPNGKAMWQEIRQGKITADLFSLNQRWVPLYNIDKTFHGLRDAYWYGKSDIAKTMLLELAQWMLDITAQLSDEQIQQMLHSEHGGLNEVFVDIARISGEDRYLVLAKKLSHRHILEPLLKGQDELSGLHANTQIPKIIGMLKVADAEQSKAWADAAAFFWETVTQNRSVSIGGNSVREHFHDSADFTPMVQDVEGPETCNTYNMLKLSKLLFLQSGDSRYLDYYERATYNHILSSVHPQHGGLVYFTPMRPGHYRMYSSVQDSMWCCVGSGIENHSKYGELIYSHSVDNLLVNLFISSTLHWQEKGLKLTLRSAFPDSNQVTLSVNRTGQAPIGEFSLSIRQPSWFTQTPEVLINQQKVKVQAVDGYIQINHRWQDGDQIHFALPAQLHTEQLPDGQDYYSVMYGPVVLATRVNAFENESLSFVADNSRMGHIAAGPTCPPEALPVMIDDPATFIKGLHRNDTANLSFTSDSGFAIGNTIDGEAPSTTLIPFFRLHDSRYQIYWPQMSHKDFAEFVVSAKAQTEQDSRLRAITVDALMPGEQQPEVEHQFAGQDTRAGVNSGQHWRDATGWFEYQLNNPEKLATTLRIRYFSKDVDRRFTISINGEVLQRVSLPVGQPEQAFYEVDYKLLPNMVASTTLVVRFSADADSVAGGIYGIRLLAQ